MIDIATSVRTALINTRPNLPEITNESSFVQDLHCDAIDMVCIELAVSDDCNVELPSCAFENCGTIGDLAALVERLKGRAA
jgi:acyl carrier protein